MCQINQNESCNCLFCRAVKKLESEGVDIESVGASQLMATVKALRESDKSECPAVWVKIEDGSESETWELT